MKKYFAILLLSAFLVLGIGTVSAVTVYQDSGPTSSTTQKVMLSHNPADFGSGGGGSTSTGGDQDTNIGDTETTSQDGDDYIPKDKCEPGGAYKCVACASDEQCIPHCEETAGDCSGDGGTGGDPCEQDPDCPEDGGGGGGGDPPETCEINPDICDNGPDPIKWNLEVEQDGEYVIVRVTNEQGEIHPAIENANWELVDGDGNKVRDIKQGEPVQEFKLPPGQYTVNFGLPGQAQDAIQNGGSSNDGSSDNEDDSNSNLDRIRDRISDLL